MKKLIVLVILALFITAGCGGTAKDNRDTGTGKSKTSATAKDKTADSKSADNKTVDVKTDQKTDTKKAANNENNGKIIEKPSAKDTEAAQQTAQKILDLTKSQDWSKLYDYLHPDIQAKYSRQTFIDDRKQSAGFYAKIKENKVNKVVLITDWKDDKGTGNTYKEAAEVAYTSTFDMDDPTMRKRESVMHLAKASDGTWRNFWIPTSQVK